MRRLRGHRAPARSRMPAIRAPGFTLVEMTVCTGILLILLGVLAPAIGQSAEHARMVRDAAQLQQCMTLVSLYASDHRGAFPVSDSNPFRASERWYAELQSAGYIASPLEVDPAAYRKFGTVTFHLSVCLVYSPDHMLPGRTLPVDKAISSVVWQHSVPYPSSKGGMLKRDSGEGTVADGAHWFCCVVRWRAPVVMCDNSALITDSIEMNHGRPPLIVDWIGAPVWTTWGGYLGRDR